MTDNPQLDLHRLNQLSSGITSKREFHDKSKKQYVPLTKRISRFTSMLNKNGDREKPKRIHKSSRISGSILGGAIEFPPGKIIISEPKLQSDSMMIDTQHCNILNNENSFIKPEKIESVPMFDNHDTSHSSSLANHGMIEGFMDSTDSDLLPSINSSSDIPEKNIIPHIRHSSNTLSSLYDEFEQIKHHYYDTDHLSVSSDHTNNHRSGECTERSTPIHESEGKIKPKWDISSACEQTPSSPEKGVAMETYISSNLSALQSPQKDEILTISTPSGQFDIAYSSNSTLPTTDVSEDEFIFDNTPPKAKYRVESADTYQKYSNLSRKIRDLGHLPGGKHMDSIKELYAKHCNPSNKSTDLQDSAQETRSISTWRPNKLVSRAIRKDFNGNNCTVTNELDDDELDEYTMGLIGHGISGDIFEQLSIHLSNLEKETKLLDCQLQMQLMETQYLDAKLRHLQAREKSHNAEKITGLPHILPLSINQSSLISRKHKSYT